MKTPKRALGDKGESIAAKYLSERGHRVVEVNYQKPWGEIDLITQKGKDIHFIEVKTQTIKRGLNQSDFYEAEEKVDYKKRLRLRRIVQTYLAEKRLYISDYWVDVIAVYLNIDGGVEKIEYIEDITL